MSGKCKYGKELPDGDQPCDFCGATPDQDCQGPRAEKLRAMMAMQPRHTPDKRR